MTQRTDYGIGAVRFSGGRILYFEYNHDLETCIPTLYKTEQEVIDNFGNDIVDNWNRCECQSNYLIESAHIMVKYLGSWWGEACIGCMCITSDIQRTRFDSTFTSGDPAWSPWFKQEQERERELLAPVVPGFSFENWLDDENTEIQEQNQ